MIFFSSIKRLVLYFKLCIFVENKGVFDVTVIHVNEGDEYREEKPLVKFFNLFIVVS